MRNGRAEFPTDRDTRDTIERATSPNLAAQRTPRDVVRGLEMRRRSRLVRIVTIGVIIPILLLIPSAFIPSFDGASLIALLAGLVGAAAAYILNRMGLVIAASLTLVGGMALAIAFVLVGKSISQHGIDLNDLRLYDLFLIPIVLSGVLAGRRGSLILTAITSTFTVVSLLLLPKTPTLQAYWGETYPYALGSAYDVLAIAFFAQWLTAAAAWLGADSVRRALLDASRADELAAALRRTRAGGPYTPPAYTGTSLDQVLVEISVLRNVTPGGSA